jgi:hypothetical protein
MAQAETNARKVVEAMHDMLPVELCDSVYSYLIPRHTVQDVSNIFFNSFPDFPVFPTDAPMFRTRQYIGEGSPLLPPLPPPPPPPFFFPHRDNVHPPEYTHPGGRIFRPEYISQDAAVEAAKLYYQGNTFKVHVPCHPRSLNRFLTVDRFGLGLEPFALIQKLYLELPAECCRSRRCHRIRRDRLPDANADEKRRLDLYRTEVATNLALLPIENLSKMRFTLVITLKAASIKPEDVLTAERYFLNMLFVIQGIVYDLKRHGGKVSVCARVRSGKKVDITSLFPLSTEEWQEVCSVLHCGGYYMLTWRQKTVDPQSETTYIPLHADGVASGQPYEDITALIKEARHFWGYESFQSLIFDPSLDGAVE